jgi:uncharacterized protein YjbI with pentapeptide repeats
LYETSFIGAVAPRLDLNHAVLLRPNFRGAELSGVRGAPAWVVQGSAGGRYLPSQIALAIRHGLRDLQGADLRDSDLRNLDLTKRDYSYADLSGADLSGSNLSGSTLLLAVARKAKLTGANLGDINFAGADLEGAAIDENYRRESELWNAVGTPAWTPREAPPPAPAQAPSAPVPSAPLGAPKPAATGK